MSVVRLGPATRPRSLDDYPDVLDLRDVAQILRRSEDRTRTWLRKGGIHAVRVGGSWRVAKSVLIAFLSGEETGPLTERKNRSEGNNPGAIQGGQRHGPASG